MAGDFLIASLCVFLAYGAFCFWLGRLTLSQAFHDASNDIANEMNPLNHNRGDTL